ASQADFDDDGIGDACATCQSATFLVAGAPPHSPLILSVGTGVNPLPFAGGVLVTFPPVLEFIGFSGPTGTVKLKVPGGLAVPPLYLQARVRDWSLPQDVAISNTVLLQFLP
ncbi:MAG TPA: hypothetical protein VMV01_01655, partial [Planctomycetota bacterium]|nr:hypothetical protein [Planctomycetota bacterium]